jgi:hypothetical protein
MYQIKKSLPIVGALQFKKCYGWKRAGGQRGSLTDLLNATPQVWTSGANPVIPDSKAKVLPATTSISHTQHPTFQSPRPFRTTGLMGCPSSP